MTDLKDCVLEATLNSRVRLYDASDLMPRLKRKQKKRPVSEIDRLFFHHSGALGKEGVRGAFNSASYVVKKRKFPGPAYTFWLPYETLRDEDGFLVVLRLNPDDERSWHTGSRANDRGVACSFQGNTTKRDLSVSHMAGAEALIPWAVERYNLSLPDGISWHSKGAASGGRSKASCPGRAGEHWLKGYLRA